MENNEVIKEYIKEELNNKVTHEDVNVSWDDKMDEEPGPISFKETAEQIMSGEEEVLCVEETKKRLIEIQEYEKRIQKLYEEIEMIEFGLYEIEYSTLVNIDEQALKISLIIKE